MFRLPVALATAIIIGAVVVTGGGGGGGGLPSTHTCTGRSFFVDFASGSDANNGTSKATPWKRAPGMVGFAGSYSHVAHDCFYFKGGTTWTGVFPMELSAGGNAGDRDYYGPDYSWFTGGSWTRPVFSAASSVITGGCTDISGNADTFLCLENADYVTFDDIEFTGWTAGSCSGNDNCTAIFLWTSQHELFDHVFIHNTTATQQANFTNAKLIAQATFGSESQTIVQNSIIQCDPGNNVLDATRAVNYLYNDYISGCIGMFFPSGDSEISGTTLHDCGGSGFPAGVANAHADAIQLNPVSSPPGSYTLYVHNNTIDGTGSAGTNECELGLIGNTGETDYVYNNVSWNVQGNSWALNQDGTHAGVASFFFNNTIFGGNNGTGSCLRQVGGTWTTIKYQNNFCITSGTVLSGLSATTLVTTSNSVLTPANATAQGYTTSQTYVYSPTSGGVTINSGTDLSSNCSGTVTDLCSDTTYGATVDANNRIVVPARTSVTRPQGGLWDTGAYEFH